MGGSIKCQKKDPKKTMVQSKPKSWTETILVPVKKYGKILLIGWMAYTFLETTSFYADWFGTDYKSMLVGKVPGAENMTNSMAKNYIQQAQRAAYMAGQG